MRGPSSRESDQVGGGLRRCISNKSQVMDWGPYSDLKFYLLHSKAYWVARWLPQRDSGFHRETIAWWSLNGISPSSMVPPLKHVWPALLSPQNAALLHYIELDNFRCVSLCVAESLHNSPQHTNQPCSSWGPESLEQDLRHCTLGAFSD